MLECDDFLKIHDDICCSTAGVPSITKNLVSCSHPWAQTLQVASGPRTLGAPEQWGTTQLLKGIWRKVFQDKRLKIERNKCHTFQNYRNLETRNGALEELKGQKVSTWNPAVFRTSFSRRATSASARCSLATCLRWRFLRALEDRNPKEQKQHQSSIKSIGKIFSKKWT